MHRKFHFISGLPRAGSTLLTAILKQNPRFTSGISDPLFNFVKNIDTATNIAAGMSALVSTDKRIEIIKSIFNSFYSGGNQVCFNTNRAWTSETAWLKSVWPDFRMIVCLRDIPWILDSFERLNSLNPHTIKPLYHHQELANVYERTHMLMGGYQNFAGYVSGPLNNVKHALHCREINQIFLMDYESLVSNPERTIKQIYDFIGEPYFQHDYNNVEASWDEFDTDAKIKGLHTIRRRVEKLDRTTVLPGDLWNQYSSSTYWRTPAYTGKKISTVGPMQGNQTVPRENITAGYKQL
jgi:sulfotransferase